MSQPIMAGSNLSGGVSPSPDDGISRNRFFYIGGISMKDFVFRFFGSNGAGNECILSGPSLSDCLEYFNETRPGCEIREIEAR